MFYLFREGLIIKIKIIWRELILERVTKGKQVDEDVLVFDLNFNRVYL